ncbi:MAG: SAM-dependent chlorinase/fluorinase [Acidobacteria bacterium]|nr:SAM-dependent chlorinase/fluorinase [Acidobacteriota bacterium]
MSENETEAEIIHTDNFGNLVTNLKHSDLPKDFMLEINGKIIKKRQEFYAEAEKDEVFMILGSAGFLEIVAFQNRAERILSVENGEQIILRMTK